MLVAITGKPGAGKDTAAEALIKTLGFSPIEFATPLKESCMFKFGLSEEDMFTKEGQKKHHPEWGMTTGEILRKEGMEATKAVWGDDFLIRRWRMTYEAFLDIGQADIVVTDCRFDEEAEAILALGGKVIKMLRPEAAPLDGRNTNHTSERDISDRLVTQTVLNDSSIADLTYRVLATVQGWRND